MGIDLDSYRARIGCFHHAKRAKRQVVPALHFRTGMIVFAVLTVLHTGGDE